jgi:hypothetical protein
MLYSWISTGYRSQAIPLPIDARMLLHHMSSEIIRSCDPLGRVPAGLNRTIQKLLLSNSLGMLNFDMTFAGLARWEA